MKRALLGVFLGGVAAVALGSPASAYTPPETDPRIVITTSAGPILVALAPENAPQHVANFLTALADQDFVGATAARVSPDFYVQMVGKIGRAQLGGLPVERVKVGIVHGAMSIYDSGKPGDIPTLMFVLVTSHQLDSDYTSIGFVEAGMGVLQKMATTPTVGDHQPTDAITITDIHFASAEERATLRQAEQTPSSHNGTSLLAAIFILAFAAFLAAGISAFRDRLQRQWVTSLWLMVALLSFFAVWVGVGASGHGSSVAAIVLFGGAIGMFRLMGRFERPAVLQPSSSPASQIEKPAQRSDDLPSGGALDANVARDGLEVQPHGPALADR